MFSTSTRGWVGKRAGRPLRCRRRTAASFAPRQHLGCLPLATQSRAIDLDDEVGERVGAERERRKPRHRSPPSLRASHSGHALRAASTSLAPHRTTRPGEQERGREMEESSAAAVPAAAKGAPLVRWRGGEEGSGGGRDWQVNRQASYSSITVSHKPCG